MHVTIILHILIILIFIRLWFPFVKLVMSFVFKKNSHYRTTPFLLALETMQWLQLFTVQNVVYSETFRPSPVSSLQSAVQGSTESLPLSAALQGDTSQDKRFSMPCL